MRTLHTSSYLLLFLALSCCTELSTLPLNRDQISPSPATSSIPPKKPEDHLNGRILSGAGAVRAGMGREIKTETCSSGSSCEASCASDKSVLGGGCFIEGDATLLDSYPVEQGIDGHDNDGWACTITQHNNLANTFVKSIAICAYIY